MEDNEVKIFLKKEDYVIEDDFIPHEISKDDMDIYLRKEDIIYDMEIVVAFVKGKNDEKDDIYNFDLDNFY